MKTEDFSGRKQNALRCLLESELVQQVRCDVMQFNGKELSAGVWFFCAACRGVVLCLNAIN